MIYADISKDDTANRESESVVRDGKLYDRANHTYQWERNVNADIVWLFDLDEVPIPVLEFIKNKAAAITCLLYTSPSPRDMRRSRMPSSA